MTPEQQTLLIIKGTIAEMPEDDREEVMRHYRDLQERCAKFPLATLAIALIGAEIAALP